MLFNYIAMCTLNLIKKQLPQFMIWVQLFSKPELQLSLLFKSSLLLLFLSVSDPGWCFSLWNNKSLLGQVLRLLISEVALDFFSSWGRLDRGGNLLIGLKWCWIEKQETTRTCVEHYVVNERVSYCAEQYSRSDPCREYKFMLHH